MTLGVEVRARGSGPRSFFESRVRESEFYVQLALLDGGRVVAVSVGKFWQLPPIFFLVLWWLRFLLSTSPSLQFDCVPIWLDNALPRSARVAEK